ncbi:MAG: ABC-type Na+ efflux pump permease component [Amycolatopsis sp.]|uniref:ABC transporter permease n=1 Tax=Amycolatopsis sp. TaxID=37632 RepID=UPI0026063443|nr:ABC transporter permease [Amycolatopsis sp.]MCU1684926.1 ABC-type Na+ efflux pump permease component [Amycolatopsis sp.]
MNTPGTRRPVTPLNAIRLVAKRELNTRLRTRAFLFGTAVILVVAAGYFLLQATLLSNSGHSKIGLTGQATGISDQLKAAGQQVGKTIDTVSVKSEEDGKEEVKNGDLYALLSGSASDLQAYTKSNLDAQIHSALDSVAQQQVLNAELLEAHLDGPQVLSTASAARVSVTSITPADPDRDQRLIIGVIMVFLLYMSITTYGTLVAQGVVEEKSSRVVEILLSTVKPWHLMLGKVLGLGLTGLIQLVILAGAGLGMATASGTLSVSGVAISTLLWGLLWYILGFFLYATVFAAAGSLVSRQEDAQSVLTPVTMVLVIGFIVGLNLMLQSPDSSATTVLSLIPLLSPVLMPGRIAAGLAPGWQIGLSIVLTIALIGVLTWLAGRIYRNAVLRTGSRVRLRDALRA